MPLKKNAIEINDTFDLAQSLGLDRDVGKELMELCRQNDISFLGLFGSFSRGEQTPNSDIDLLVSFSRGKSLIDHIRIENDLETLLGTKVDLVTEKSLNPYIAPMVRKDLRRVYCEE
ncbi:nucleotidyltransferase family protein [uncultured Methanolobus sp.]|uniref:nucleotidyltransferase family protein n=1 Tax=uncultured Methanolobus sp. TaxID=218300 RepID=UPI0029C98AF8|nr:nucleotidyltransferase family protein [uncultured Methanolobus sp.]